MFSKASGIAALTAALLNPQPKTAETGVENSVVPPATSTQPIGSLHVRDLPLALNPGSVQEALLKGATSPKVHLVGFNPRTEVAADEPAQQGGKKSHNFTDAEVKSFVEKVKRNEPESLADIPKELFSDRDFVRSAARRLPEVLERAPKELQNDLPFLKEIIVEKVDAGRTSYHTQVFGKIKPEHRDNREFMEGFLKEDLGVYRDASERLRSDPEFLRLAIKSGTTIHLSSVPEKLRNDPAIISEVFSSTRVFVGRSEELADLIPARMLEDKSFLLTSSQKNPELFKSLSPELLKDKEFIKDVVARSYYVYKELPETVQEDRDIARAFYRSNHYAILDLPEGLLKDRKFLAELLKQNGAGFEHLPEELKKEPALILSAVETKGSIVSMVPKEVLASNTELQQEIARRNFNSRFYLEERVGKLPNSVTKIFTDTKEAFKILGFSEHTYEPKPLQPGTAPLGRFDASQEIIRNRFEVSSPEIKEKLVRTLGEQYFAGLPDKSDTRPKTGAILPYADDTSAFTQRDGFFFSYDFIDEATRENKVILYEVGTGEAGIEAINELKASGKLDDMVLGAHGQFNAMSFGGVDPTETTVHPDDPRFVTTSNREFFKAMSGAVKDDGTVILMSCSTGGKGNTGINMATAIHAALPHCKVYAPEAPTTVVRVVDEQTGLITRPSFKVNFLEVGTFEAPAIERQDFNLAGLDENTKHACDTVLNGSTYPIHFESKVDKDGVAFPTVFENGTESRSLARYDPEKQRFVPLQGREASLEAAKIVVQTKLFDILTSNKTNSLWKNWTLKEGEPGYIDSNNENLVATKREIAKEIGIAPESISLDFKIFPGGLTATVLLREGGKERSVATLTGTPADNERGLLILDSSKVDLESLGRAMRGGR